jgi:hypothetical protein
MAIRDTSYESWKNEKKKRKSLRNRNLGLLW